MIKAYSAYTEELDDPKAMAADILGQLALDGRLLANSIGIIYCHVSCIEEKTATHLAGCLPFDVVGCSSPSVSANNGCGQLGLCLMVLTSDDVTFAVCKASGILGKQTMRTSLADMHSRAFAGLDTSPGLVLALSPFALEVGMDAVLDELALLFRGIPLFGAVAFTDSADYNRVYTLHNDEDYNDTLVLVGMFGAVEPHLDAITITDENIIEQRAVVTACDGVLLSGINNMSARDYFGTQGLNMGKARLFENMSFVFGCEDGRRLIRTCLGSTDDGSLMLSGHVEAGSSLSVVTSSPDDVTRSAWQLLERVAPLAENRCVLACSCTERYWSLGLSENAEHEAVRRALGTTPYLMMYSAGEICARIDDDATVHNQLLNDSLAVCVL